MTKAMTMDELLANEDDSVKQLAQGDAVVGTVLSIRKHEVLAVSYTHLTLPTKRIV